MTVNSPLPIFKHTVVAPFRKRWAVTWLVFLLVSITKKDKKGIKV